MKISETCKAGLDGFYYLPKGLANSTDIIDKFCKLALAILECNIEIKQSFKDTTGIFSTFGLITTLKPMFDPSGAFWNDRKKNPLSKIASKVTLAAAQVLDMLKGLDALKFVSLGNISNAIGRYPVCSNILRMCPTFGVAKDALIVLSTGFSIKTNWDEGSRLEKLDLVAELKKAENNLKSAQGEFDKINKKNTDELAKALKNIQDLEGLIAKDPGNSNFKNNQIKLKFAQGEFAIIKEKTDKELKVSIDKIEIFRRDATIMSVTSKQANAIHTNRIAIIADLFKLAIVGLTLGLVIYGVGMSTVVYTTSYGALTVGAIANGIGLISASAGLIKALRGYSVAEMAKA